MCAIIKHTKCVHQSRKWGCDIEIRFLTGSNLYINMILREIEDLPAFIYGGRNNQKQLQNKYKNRQQQSTYPMLDYLVRLW